MTNPDPGADDPTDDPTASTSESTTAGDGYVVRTARAADLRHLQDIEASGSQQYVDAFGPDLNPILLSTPSTGAWRGDQPGFVLVAAPTGSVAPWESGSRSEPVGFAHVIEIDDGGWPRAHLEQLSVRPKVQRRGLGARLVRAARAEARRRGHGALSLCTYRDVAFNEPFYAGLGFVEVTELAPYQQRLHDHEVRIGLDRDGERVVMSVPLR